MACAPALAQPARDSDDTHTGIWHLLGADAKSYVTAPLHAGRTQWIRFGGALAAIGLAYHHDDNFRDHFVPAGTVSTDASSHDTADALPAALAFGGTWLAATLLHDDSGRREVGSMLEAAVFSSAATALIKRAAGRERPYISADHRAWGEGGASFPSGHVTAAFAIGTVLAESGNDRQRLVRRVLGYGMAVGTAYQRMNHDAHWFSDVVAGGAIGMATARFVMKRREPSNDRAWMVLPTQDGLQIGYTIALR
jgi:membrane-associated phospholipid phosphatase